MSTEITKPDRLSEVVNNAQEKKGRSRRPKQEAFEEMKQEEIPAISAAAERYVRLRDERMVIGREEVEAREFLIGLMHEHKLTVYTVGNLTASLESKEKVKAKLADDEEEPDTY